MGFTFCSLAQLVKIRKYVHRYDLRCQICYRPPTMSHVYDITRYSPSLSSFTRAVLYNG